MHVASGGTTYSIVPNLSTIVLTVKIRIVLTDLPGALVKEVKSGNFKLKRIIFKLLIQNNTIFVSLTLPPGALVNISLKITICPNY